MALYQQKDSKIWWYEFRFAGQRIRESSKSASKKVAGEAERVRRRQLEENYNSIKKPEPPKIFFVAADEYIAIRRSELAPKSMDIIERGINQLLPFVGKKALSEITLLDIKRFVDARLAQGSSNRYINMAVEVLRAILRRNHQWERLRPFYRKLKEPKSVGKELSHEEEKRLLAECHKSPSRGLASRTILGIYTGMRNEEIRSLRWRQIDLDKAYLTVGKSKTEHGEGRIIPLIGPALQEIKEWSARFPNRLPDHYVFPAEKYASNAKQTTGKIYAHNPNQPMGSFRKAWGTAQRRAGVHLRFHDLRHTTVTRLLDAGQTLEQIRPILGWSAATMVEMMIRYQHRDLEKRRQTMLALVPKKRPSKSKSKNNKSKRRAAGD